VSPLTIALRSVPCFAGSCSCVFGSISATANCLPSTEPASGSQKLGPQLNPQFAERVHPGRRRAAERLYRAAGSEERRGHDGSGARTKEPRTNRDSAREALPPCLPVRKVCSTIHNRFATEHDLERLRSLLGAAQRGRRTSSPARSRRDQSEALAADRPKAATETALPTSALSPVACWR
jgi:hypothetical protein